MARLCGSWQSNQPPADTDKRQLASPTCVTFPTASDSAKSTVAALSKVTAADTWLPTRAGLRPEEAALQSAPLTSSSWRRADTTPPRMKLSTCTPPPRHQARSAQLVGCSRRQLRPPPPPPVSWHPAWSRHCISFDRRQVAFAVASVAQCARKGCQEGGGGGGPGCRRRECRRGRCSGGRRSTP